MNRLDIYVCVCVCVCVASVPAWQRTPSVSIRKTSWLTVLQGKTTVYFKDHTKDINTLCKKNAVFSGYAWRHARVTVGLSRAKVSKNIMNMSAKPNRL